MTEPETEGETVTFVVEGGGEHTELVVPRELVELLATEDDTLPEVVADIAQFGFTRRIYEGVHLSEGEVDTDIRTIEIDARALFEAHFGTSFEELLDKHERVNRHHEN